MTSCYIRLPHLISSWFTGTKMGSESESLPVLTIASSSRNRTGETLRHVAEPSARRHPIQLHPHDPSYNPLFDIVLYMFGHVLIIESCLLSFFNSLFQCNPSIHLSPRRLPSSGNAIRATLERVLERVLEARPPATVTSLNVTRNGRLASPGNIFGAIWQSYHKTQYVSE